MPFFCPEGNMLKVSVEEGESVMNVVRAMPNCEVISELGVV
jgi:hypothetical protein